MIAGRFRRDLYYRLNIFPIQLPPLRERIEDIPVLAAHFIKVHAKKIGRRIEALSPIVLQELMTYDWPGNIRELENLLERSVLLASGSTIEKVDLPSTKWDSAGNSDNEMPVRLRSLADNEKQHILSVLKYCGEQVSGKSGAAAILGIPPSTLISRMKRLGITKEHVERRKIVSMGA
jgi:formate hydrogenlyase transcriptional activator